MKKLFFISILTAITLFCTSLYSQAELTIDDITILPTGKLVMSSPAAKVASTAEIKNISDNGRYWCTYDIGAVYDEVREMINFKLYEDGKLLYSLDQAPGSDLYISNSGIVAFMDNMYHFKGELKINFYSKEGNVLFSKLFKALCCRRYGASGHAGTGIS